MKKMILSAIALIGMTVASYGANTVEEVNTNFVMVENVMEEEFNAKITVTSNNENENFCYELNFSNLESFVDFNTEQLESILDVCTVDITITVSVGAGSTYASVTLTVKDVPCDEVGKTIKNLKNQAQQAL